MKIKEIISTLEVAKAEVEWNYPMGYIIAIEEAIGLLKKQIPLRVILNGYGFCCCADCKGWTGMKVGDIEVGIKPPQYCPHCGQALDWGETHEN